ncbi:tetratricopeptide repeat protein, partial [Streptomyces nodosus]
RCSAGAECPRCCPCWPTSAATRCSWQRNWRAAVAGHRRTGDVAAQARALSELARVQEYAGRPEEALRTCEEAVEWARRAQDTRLRAELQLRLADTLEHLGDPAAARLHRAAAERMPGEEHEEYAEDTGENTVEAKSDGDPYEIRSALIAD